MRRTTEEKKERKDEIVDFARREAEKGIQDWIDAQVRLLAAKRAAAKGARTPEIERLALDSKKAQERAVVLVKRVTSRIAKI